MRWRYEVWVHNREDGTHSLVDSGETEQRHEAMRTVSELLPGVEPVEAYAYGLVSLDGVSTPRPLKLNRSGGFVIGWTGV